MKILITGATGFIGNHVVRWLVNNTKHEIIANGTSQEKAERFDWFSKVTFIPLDYFSDSRDYFTFFGEPELLIHLGWKNAYQNTVALQLEENLPVAMHFLKNFAEHAKTKIVGIGTAQEYGNVGGCLKEDMLVNPVTPYGVAKNTLRSFVELLAKDYGFSWNWIRQFYLTGDGQNPKSLHGQLAAAITKGDEYFPMSGGEQLRDYIPVEKAAENICKIALSSYSGIVNSCTGIPRSLRDVVEEYIAEKHSSIKVNYGFYPYRDYEIMEQWGSAELLLRCKGEYGGFC